MTNLEVAAVVTVPAWLVCADLAYRDRVIGWLRRRKAARHVVIPRQEPSNVRKLEVGQR